MYVDDLIGPNTVNTMPPATVAAFDDHGKVAVTLTEGVDEALAMITALGDVGVSYDQVTRELQTEGVQTFAESMADLYATIEGKMNAELSADGPRWGRGPICGRRADQRLFAGGAGEVGPGDYASRPPPTGSAVGEAPSKDWSPSLTVSIS